MTSNTFHKLIRQYAVLSQKKRQSFAEAVNAVLQARIDSIAEETKQSGNFGAKSLEAIEAAKREYGTVDAAYAPDVLPF